MRVKIVNAATSVDVPVRATTFVAELKSRYIECEGFVGDPARVTLVFRGRVLDDLRQLGDYGIENHAVIAHVLDEGPVREAINYKDVAGHLVAAHDRALGGRPDPRDYSTNPELSTWNGEWTRGREFEEYPPVLVGSTGLTRADVWDYSEELRDKYFPEVDGDAPPQADNTTSVASVAAGAATPKAGDSATATSKAAVASASAERAAPDSGTKDAPNAAAAAGSARRSGEFRAAEEAPSSTSKMIAQLRAAKKARQAIVVRSPEPVVSYGDASTSPLHIRPPTRIFRNLYVAQVGRFMFRVLHCMEGRWTGDAEVHMQGSRGALSEVRVCTVNLSFDDMAGLWHETQSLTTPDGLVTMQSMVLRPVADSMCVVELVDSSGRPTREMGPARPSRSAAFVHSHGGVTAGGFGGRAGASASTYGRDYDMTLVEQSDRVLVLTAYSQATGRPILVETITLLSDMERVRTVQRFDEAGTFQCIYLIREERVLDAVTGAMMEAPRVRAKAPAPSNSSPADAPASSTRVVRGNVRRLSGSARV